MKKYGLITLILVLTVSLCACGRNNDTPTMPNPPVSTPAPSETPNVPEMNPTIDTNIPDPEVDSNSTMPGGITTDPGDNNQPGTGDTTNGNSTGDASNGNGTGSESGSTGEQSSTNGNSKNRTRKIK